MLSTHPAPIKLRNICEKKNRIVAEEERPKSPGFPKPSPLAPRQGRTLISGLCRLQRNRTDDNVLLEAAIPEF